MRYVARIVDEAMAELSAPLVLLYTYGIDLHNNRIKIEMKRMWLTAFIAVLVIAGSGQTRAAGQLYWVYFVDKGPDVGALLAHPEQWMNPKGLQARQKRGLKVDITDAPVYEPYIDLLHAAGYHVERVSRWLNAVVVKTNDAPDALLKIAPAIRSVQPTAAFAPRRPIIGTDKKTPRRIAAGVIDYGEADVQNSMINIEYMHDRGFTGAGVHIAALDAGFSFADVSPAFDTLFARAGIIATHNVLTGGDNVFEASSHGANVLSVIAAYQPGIMVGTGFGADFSLIIAEPDSEPYDESTWVVAAEWAVDNGADILHSSLGYPGIFEGLEHITYEQMDGNTLAITLAADIAASKGTIVINSGGNEGSDPWFYIGPPSDGDSVLAVGGVTAARNHASFSSFGPTADGRIKPDVVAMAQGVTVMGGATGQPFRANGTSFSAPLITGLAACLLQAHPGRTNWEILESIKLSGDQADAPDNVLGYGIPDAKIADSILTAWDGAVTVTEEPMPGLSGLSLQPNPATSELMIVMRAGTDIRAVEIYTSIGARVASFAYTSVGASTPRRIPISALPPGVYTLRALTDKRHVLQATFVKAP